MMNKNQKSSEMGKVELRNYRNVLQELQEGTEKYADRVALGIRTNYGWKEFTYRGVGLLSRRLACYLINDLQVKKGDRVAILSESKPEFGACIFASVLSGLVIVPLDIKLTHFEFKSILSDCEPTILMVSQHYLDQALKLKEEIPSIQHVILMDEPNYNSDLPCIYTVPNVYEAKWQHRSTRSTALIIYTSGTTGNPKGVEISFGNMFAQLKDLTPLFKNFFGKREHITLLSILPMNHLFEMTVGFSTFLSKGMSIYYSHSLKPKDILSTMRAKNVNFMIVVPAFLKLLKMGIENEINNSSPAVKIAFNTMFALAKFIPSVTLKKKMFKKIHDKFGGNFIGCIAGGAPLEPPVNKFFNRIGIAVYQGYGLTETSPVVAVNYDKTQVAESVGKPLAGFSARIDKSTGEILLKGPSVMKGYYKRPEMTAEVIDSDGWFHTGDIGKLDVDGHLYITGRIKNMIVLSGGKKVFPEEVESVLEQSELFAEVCVLGAKRVGGAKDATEDIVAVIVPKDSVLKDSPNEDDLYATVREEVKRLSNHLASYKRPVNIIIKTEPLPKTTTRKIKRLEVKKMINA